MKCMLLNAPEVRGTLHLSSSICLTGTHVCILISLLSLIPSGQLGLVWKFFDLVLTHCSQGWAAVLYKVRDV